MNQIFNIKRLGLLLKTEVQYASRLYYGLAIATFACVALLTYMMNIKGGSPVFHISAIYGMLTAFFMTIPFLLYRHLYHPKKGVTYAMLPASQFEKVLVAIIQTAVLMPLAIFAVLEICMLCIDAFLVDVISWNFKELLSFYWDTIAAQSIFFLGIFWFKYRKVAKTFLSLLIVILAFMIITATLHNMGILNTMFITTKIDDIVLNKITYIIFPLVPWIISFFKFKYTQI